jgi:hypothetical protein
VREREGKETEGQREVEESGKRELRERERAQRERETYDKVGVAVEASGLKVPKAHHPRGRNAYKPKQKPKEEW